MARTRLKQRRTIRIRLYTLLTLLFLSIVGGGAVYGVYRPEVRVQDVSVTGAEVLSPQTIGATTKAFAEGSHLLIFPKDSIFILPTNSIEEDLLKTFPRLNSVAIERTGFDSIDVSVGERTKEGMWCPQATSTPCTLIDEKGVLFAPAKESLVPVYGDLYEEGYVLGNVVFEPGAYTKVHRLKSAIEETGVTITRITFVRPDEVTFEVNGGTEIYYVLGEEAQIAEALPPILNVEDLETIEYIDMRFGNRVYIQRND